MEAIDFLKEKVDKNEEKTERLADAIVELSKSQAVSTQMLKEVSETLKDIRKELSSHHDTLMAHKSVVKTMFHIWAPIVNITATGALAAYQILIKFN